MLSKRCCLNGSYLRICHLSVVRGVNLTRDRYLLFLSVAIPLEREREFRWNRGVYRSGPCLTRASVRNHLSTWAEGVVDGAFVCSLWHLVGLGLPAGWATKSAGDGVPETPDLLRRLFEWSQSGLSALLVEPLEGLGHGFEEPSDLAGGCFPLARDRGRSPLGESQVIEQKSQNGGPVDIRFGDTKVRTLILGPEGCFERMRGGVRVLPGADLNCEILAQPPEGVLAISDLIA